ncbi:hypothetical protein RFI_38113, partial [Reticulomyxa filosa]
MATCPKKNNKKKKKIEAYENQCLPQIQVPEKVLEKYELKSRRCLRDSVVCVCPKKEDPIFRILTKIRGKYDKRAITDLPHVHLFFPFLPQEIFYEIYAIMTEAVQYYKQEKENEYLQKFELVFETFERYHGTGKQYIQKYMFDCLNHVLQSSDNKEVANTVTCLCEEERNLPSHYAPHLTLGQMTEEEFKTAKNELQTIILEELLSQTPTND